MTYNMQCLTTGTVNMAREIYDDDFILLHRPVFQGNKLRYLIDCIDSYFVSSVEEKVIKQASLLANNEYSRDKLYSEFKNTIIQASKC